MPLSVYCIKSYTCFEQDILDSDANGGIIGDGSYDHWRKIKRSEDTDMNLCSEWKRSNIYSMIDSMYSIYNELSWNRFWK